MEDLWKRWRTQRLALAVAVGAGALASLGTLAGLSYASAGSSGGAEYPRQIQYCNFGAGRGVHGPQITCRVPGGPLAPPPPLRKHGTHARSEHHKR
jgi:hypothetical protein